MSHPFQGAVAGAAGGLLGSWVMNRYHAAMHRPPFNLSEAEPGGGREDQRPRAEEPGGDPATVEFADAVARKVFRSELKPEHKPAAGTAAHYAFGAAGGLLYGMLAERRPWIRYGMGTVFAMVVWAASAELGAALAGFAKPPAKYPWKVHASAAGAHALYGLTLESTRRALRHAL